MSGKFVEPNKVVSHFHLSEGDVVADYGAGSGYFLASLVERVGDGGKVYALEIQKQLVEKLGEFAREQGLNTVEPLWCDLEELGGIPLPDASIDVGLLANTLFSFEDKVSAVKEIARTLRSGAPLHIIDWSESFKGMGPQPDMVIDQAAATDLFEANGFTIDHTFPTGDHHYGLTVRKI